MLELENDLSYSFLDNYDSQSSSYSYAYYTYTYTYINKLSYADFENTSATSDHNQ
ncbi:hypothetical protein M9Y10_023651 [Tritrichomonas musculus]|uniref:Uncharacterized protein n=1 Tax=Tritrichomonas musculus TaxID=1915356 RepID=A0ABR2KVS0_9EUKA